MPLYRYDCRVCGKSFEELRTFSARDSAKCPKCNGKADRKNIDTTENRSIGKEVCYS